LSLWIFGKFEITRSGTVAEGSSLTKTRWSFEGLDVGDVVVSTFVSPATASNLSPEDSEQSQQTHPGKFNKSGSYHVCEVPFIRTAHCGRAARTITAAAINDYPLRCSCELRRLTEHFDRHIEVYKVLIIHTLHELQVRQSFFDNQSATNMSLCPPFTAETANIKVKKAQDLWNTQ
jgi:hypothetical protein